MTEKEIYDRNIGVWDEDFQNKLKNVTVGLAGLGGSGGCLASILARNGFGKFKIADPDIFEIHNIQRQLFAVYSSLGQSKAEATKDGIKEINPAIQVAAYPAGITLENLDEFLEGCDFVHEVIDYSAPEVKIAIHRKAREKGIIVSSAAIIGTGVATLIFHPQGMSFEEYFEYDERKKEWKQSIDKIAGVYPDYINREIFLGRIAKGQVPTTADGAFLTGITTAGLYKRILMGKEVAYAPKMVRWDMLDDQFYNRAILG